VDHNDDGISCQCQNTGLIRIAVNEVLHLEQWVVESQGEVKRRSELLNDEAEEEECGT
jgi:hypothetical protein